MDDNQKDWRYGNKKRRLLWKSKSKKHRLENLKKIKNPEIRINAETKESSIHLSSRENDSNSQVRDFSIIRHCDGKNELPNINNPTDNSLNNDLEPYGRRVVDIGFLLQTIREIKHPGFHCTFSNLKFEQEIKEGFHSTFIYNCEVCGIKEKIPTEQPKTTKCLNINSAFTIAMVNTGQGFSQLEEISAVLNMPCMSNRSYQKYHNNLSDSMYEVAFDEMKAAGIEEAKYALEKGELDELGRPCITVVADGAWSKRSYRKNYNALSGVASIIGYRTKKVLFMGVRNKYCAICEAALKSGKVVRFHTCYKNWSGTSTAMESDIIVEGFKDSIPMHNLVYSKVIGDGDSSVIKKLNLAKPYGSNFAISKIECTNHILRNYINRLRDMTVKRKSNEGTIIPGQLRKILRDRLRKLRSAVTMAVQYRMNQDMPHNEKVFFLKQDIINSPYHVFGSHVNCDQYFCKNKKDEINFVPDMQLCGLFNDIMSALHLMAHHSSSLIYGVNNNCVEGYNSVVAKFVGGKRINFSLRGSYQTRCSAAVVSHNAGPLLMRNLHKKITNHSPGYFSKSYINKKKNASIIRKNNIIKSKVSLFKSKKKIKFSGPDEDYGDVDKELEFETLDVDPQELEKQKFEFLENLKKSKEEILKLAKNTLGQSQCQEWIKERQIRLTASNFGKICKLRPTTNRKKTLMSLLYNRFEGNETTKYGIEHEPFAVADFENVMKIKIQPAGLFIDEELQFLAASPDGLINGDTLLEIKCPFSISQMTPIEAIENGTIKWACLKNGELCLKESHNYFYQIQGQLHITQRLYGRPTIVMWKIEIVLFGGRVVERNNC